MITQQRLKELLHYDPETGIFTWRVDIRSGRNNALVKAKAGEVAGCQSGYGYWSIGVETVRTSRHRLAWLYMTGELPIRGVDIDHVDGNRCNDKWDNLRLATRSQNMQNLKRAHSDSGTGFLGVERKRGKFAARIALRGKRYNLGVFDTPEEAHAEYLKAKRKLHEAGTL